MQMRKVQNFSNNYNRNSYNNMYFFIQMKNLKKINNNFILLKQNIARWSNHITKINYLSQRNISPSKNICNNKIHIKCHNKKDRYKVQTIIATTTIIQLIYLITINLIIQINIYNNLNKFHHIHHNKSIKLYMCKMNSSTIKILEI